MDAWKEDRSDLRMFMGTEYTREQYRRIQMGYVALFVVGFGCCLACLVWASVS